MRFKAFVLKRWEVLLYTLLFGVGMGLVLHDGYVHIISGGDSPLRIHGLWIGATLLTLMYVIAVLRS